MSKHSTPSDIERTSIHIITEELAAMNIELPPENAAVVKRVIHATADFDYAFNLVFTPHACARTLQALQQSAVLVTDTNMTLSGLSKKALGQLGATAECYMADPDVAALAKQQGTTRAVASMQKAAHDHPGCLLAVGNAPTALFELCRQMRQGFRPQLVVAVPVGFVNVVEAKEQTLALCRELDVPCIAAMGRKGGSTVSAAICNALLYSATDMLDPSARGWN